jgi:hypothetical protein
VCLCDGKAYLLPVSELFETKLNDRVVHVRTPLRDGDVISVGGRHLWVVLRGGVSLPPDDDEIDDDEIDDAPRNVLDAADDDDAFVVDNQLLVGTDADLYRPRRRRRVSARDFSDSAHADADYDLSNDNNSEADDPVPRRKAAPSLVGVASKVVDAAAAATRSALQAAAQKRSLDKAPGYEVNTSVTYANNTLRATSTFTLALSADADAAVAAAVPMVAAAPDDAKAPFVSPLPISGAPAAAAADNNNNNNAMPPPPAAKPTKRKLATESPNSRKRNAERQRVGEMQRQYTSKQERASQAAPAQRAASQQQQQQQQSAEENSQNDLSGAKSVHDSELQKLTSTGRYAKLWQPTGSRRAPKLNRRLH